MSALIIRNTCDDHSFKKNISYKFDDLQLRYFIYKVYFKKILIIYFLHVLLKSSEDSARNFSLGGVKPKEENCSFFLSIFNRLKLWVMV